MYKSNPALWCDCPSSSSCPSLIFPHPVFEVPTKPRFCALYLFSVTDIPHWPCCLVAFTCNARIEFALLQSETCRTLNLCFVHILQFLPHWSGCLYNLFATISTISTCPAFFPAPSLTSTLTANHIWRQFLLLVEAVFDRENVMTFLKTILEKGCPTYPIYSSLVTQEIQSQAEVLDSGLCISYYCSTARPGVKHRKLWKNHSFTQANEATGKIHKEQSVEVYRILFYFLF